MLERFLHDGVSGNSPKIREVRVSVAFESTDLDAGRKGTLAMPDHHLMLELGHLYV